MFINLIHFPLEEGLHSKVRVRISFSLAISFLEDGLSDNIKLVNLQVTHS